VGVGLATPSTASRVLGGGVQRGGVVREDHEVREEKSAASEFAEGGGCGGPHEEGGGEEHDPDRDRQQHREVAARLVTDLWSGEAQHHAPSPVSAAETDSGVGWRTSPAIRPSREGRRGPRRRRRWGRGDQMTVLPSSRTEVRSKERTWRRWWSRGCRWARPEHHVRAG
jgi:hypothetical protein